MQQAGSGYIIIDCVISTQRCGIVQKVACTYMNISQRQNLLWRLKLCQWLSYILVGPKIHRFLLLLAL